MPIAYRNLKIGLKLNYPLSHKTATRLREAAKKVPLIGPTTKREKGKGDRDRT